MLSKVFDCPGCKHRFSFEYSGELPNKITCPSCEKTRFKNEFLALIICPECRTKLRMPMGMVYAGDNVCPECNTTLDPKTVFPEDHIENGGSSGVPQLLQDGDFFDKYKIIRLLGKGGMAEVYLAEHLLLNRKCALKLMRGAASADDPVFVKRFLREAKISNAVEHENIVKVFDVGSDFKSGSLFIAMEYVEGKTLTDIMHNHELSEKELKEILVAMAGALKALAAAKVVHRDIKPSNIMLDNSGVLKLMDLGIAKASDSDIKGEMTLTMEQSTIGTPNYASPEQCRSAHSADIRSDIYSLGATLYHLAARKLPFDGVTVVETLLNVMQEDPAPLKKLRPDLSSKFSMLIEKMMSKDITKRPQTPDELLKLAEGIKVSNGKSIWDNAFFNFFRPSFASSRKNFVLRMAALGTVVFMILVLFLGGYIFAEKQYDENVADVEKDIGHFEKIISKMWFARAGKVAEKRKNKADAEKIKPVANVQKEAFHYNWLKRFSEAVATDSIQQQPLLILFDDPGKKVSGFDIRQYLSGDYPEKSYLYENYVLLYLDCSAEGKGLTREHHQENLETWERFCPSNMDLPVLATATPDGRFIGILDDFSPGKFAENLRGIREDCPEWIKNYNSVERSIDVRLHNRNLYLRMLERRKQTPVCLEMIDYVRKQIAELKKQQKIRAEVKKARENSYSAELTTTYKELVEEFLRMNKKLPRRGLIALQRDEMRLKILSHPEVDPNVFIDNGRYEMPLVDVLKRGGVHHRHKDFMRILLEKKVDVNTPWHADDRTPEELLFFGLENVDAGFKGDPLQILLAKRIECPVGDNPPLGVQNGFHGARKMLLLAPLVNDVVDENGKTMLHYAAERDDIQWAKELIYTGFTQWRRRDNNGLTAWDTALMHGSSKCVELFKNLKMDNDNSPSAVQYKLICGVIKRERKMIRQAIEAGANVYKPWYNRMNSLQNACAAGDYGIVEYLLKEQKVDPDKYERLSDRFVCNPLHLAIVTGRLDIMQLLLNYGADPAVMVNHPRIGKCSLGIIAVHKYCKVEEGSNLCIEILRLLMKHNKKFNINAVEEDRTSLLYEVCVRPGYKFYSEDQVAIIRFLLNSGAIPSKHIIRGKALNEYPMDEDILGFLIGKEPPARKLEKESEGDGFQESYEEKSTSQTIIGDLKNLVKEGKEKRNTRRRTR